MTPMLKQYTSIRKSLPDDALLFFRLGDFYELFMDDAQEAAGLLGQENQRGILAALPALQRGHKAGPG